MLDYEGQGYHPCFYIISILLSLLPATCMKGESFTQVRSLKQGGYAVGEGPPPVLAFQWLDNKVVYMISTSANANAKVQATRKTRVAGVWDPHRRVDQLQVFHNYNRFMIVDRYDQIVATHSVHGKIIR